MLWCVLFSACIIATLGAPAEDEVTSLPGLRSQPSWKHYSGYLKATGTKMLHYWFVESANQPSKDPVVLWMNGGPGCSSDLGLLTEHGPFRIAKDGSGVLYNKYSWNNVANMLYLEAPAGVGFSYSKDKNYTTDDNEVAKDNLMALLDFFHKFPEYVTNPFFITGESYGGIYVPTLSALVLQQKTINFQGMAIGNGITNFSINDNSLLYFGYYHGLFGEKYWESLLKTCCPNGIGMTTYCHFVSQYNRNSDCNILVEQALSVIYNSGLNEYNLYAPCEVPKPSGYIYTNESFLHDLPSMGHRSHPHMIKKINKFRLHQLYEKSVRVTPPCLDYSYVISYMNTEQVKEALHVTQSRQDWDVCSAEVGALYRVIYKDVTTLYQTVLNAGKRVLVYNGDVDMACNFLGCEWFVESLNLTVVNERQPWFYQDNTGSKQVAGFVKQFKGLKLTTIRGAGHMVPQDAPLPALEMFTDFLHPS